MTEFDLVVRGGEVIDGTGTEGRTADVAVRDGTIVEVGQVGGKGRQEIAADGAIITPGFVDIHTHYDGQVTWANRLHPSSHHGVTTVVMGNCGVGFAPVRPQDHDMLIELMEGVEDIPGAILHEGLSWDWQTFPEYMDMLSERQFDMDVGAQIPHAALRVYAMGQRGADREPATPAEVAEMRRIVAEGVAAGALGVSTSRSLNHRTSKGAPTPSLKAEYEELLGLALGLKDAGRGVFEMISDLDDLEQEFGFFRGMVAKSGRPMSISLAQGLNTCGWRAVLGKIEQANADGLVMRGQVAPRPIGILMGLTTTICPFTTRKAYKEIRTLPVPERIKAMRDPARRAAILGDEPSRGFAVMHQKMEEGHKVWLLGDPPDYEPAPESSMAARAAAAGQDVWSYIYDRLIENQGSNIFYSPFANYEDHNLDCCREMILHDNTVMGLSDGGAHVGTICDASFITTLFTHWGRDRNRGERIDLPTLVKNQTRDTARAVDLHDRGVVAPGMKADLNVIDFENLSLHAPEMVQDLPAGGSRFEQKTSGYLATLVSGEVTYLDGEATDALPGRLIR